MSKSINQFLFLMKKNDRVSDDCWKATTEKRKSVIIPTGFKIFDTTLNVTFIGDGASYGGVTIGDKDEARVIVTAAASAFTSADTFGTISAAASGIFTDASHGLVTGDSLIPMATDATYGLTQDTVYAVVKIDANTFTLTGVTPEDQTADLVWKKYSVTNNNYITWAQGAYLRTGDAITAANGGGTLPSGLSNATAYYVIKDDTPTGGGADRNSDTKFRVASSRNNALAGTVVKIRDAGSVGFTLVPTNAYLRNCDKTVLCSAAAVIDVFLPSGTTAGVGARYEVANSGATAVTVKSAAGTVDGAAAGTGKVLKGNALDFITIVSDATNWCAVSKQITP
jgi:hypothetical protein